MNKKGNVFLGLVIAFFIWSSGILMLPFIVDSIDVTRTDLVCSSNTISFGTKTLCLTIDLIVPIILWTLFTIVLGLIISKN